MKSHQIYENYSDELAANSVDKQTATAVMNQSVLDKELWITHNV